MEIWKIMIGLQAIVTLISLAATIWYMRKPEEEGDSMEVSKKGEETK